MQFKGELNESETNLKFILQKIFVAACDGTFFVIMLLNLYSNMFYNHNFIICLYLVDLIGGYPSILYYLKCIDLTPIHMLSHCRCIWWVGI